MIPESVAGALFSNDRRQVLLIKRRDVPVWVLPGGGIDAGETPEEAIVREILEETGFRVKVSRLAGKYSPINRLTRPTFLYDCSILEGQPTTSSETKEVRFFPLNEIPLMPPPYLEWVQDAHTQGPLLQKDLSSVTYWGLFKLLVRYPLLVFRFLLSRMGFHLNT